MDSAVGRFEANEAAVFGRMDLFAKRCRKLIELFTIIHQFSELAKVCTSSNLFLSTHRKVGVAYQSESVPHAFPQALAFMTSSDNIVFH